MPGASGARRKRPAESVEASAAMDLLERAAETAADSTGLPFSSTVPVMVLCARAVTGRAKSAMMRRVSNVNPWIRGRRQLGQGTYEKNVRGAAAPHTSKVHRRPRVHRCPLRAVVVQHDSGITNGIRVAGRADPDTIQVQSGAAVLRGPVDAVEMHD